MVFGDPRTISHAPRFGLARCGRGLSVVLLAASWGLAVPLASQAVVASPAVVPSTAVVSSTAAVAGQQVGDDRHDAPLAERFQARLDSLWSAAQGTEEHFPGATAAYITPTGEVHAFATGYSDVDRRVRMDPDMRMPSGSIGKTYAAALALSMHFDGTLDLDDPISKWVGDRYWFDRLPNGPDITLRHLLNHSSGLIDHAFDSPEFHEATARIIRGGNLDATLSYDELVEFVLDRDPLFPAGLGYNYTDTGYVIAGLVMEAAAGGDYYDELHARLLGPLGLEKTHPQNSRSAPMLSQGYGVVSSQLFGMPLEVVGSDGRMRFNPSLEFTGGGLYNNPQSLVRWAKLLYEGDAIDADYLGDLLESAVRGAAPVPQAVYSLGVRVTQMPFGISYGHSGFFPGYNSGMFYFPAEGVAVALQINTDASSGGEHIIALARMVVDEFGSN